MITTLDLQKVQKITKDDPVRPNIPSEFRVSKGREVYALFEDQFAEFAEPLIKDPLAVICVAYTNDVPTTEQELEKYTQEDGSIAIFYTVWSYEKGAGRQIVFDTAKKLVDKGVERFVTLSPPTEMARKFHLKNGAVVLKENKETVNYEYPKEVL